MLAQSGHLVYHLRLPLSFSPRGLGGVTFLRSTRLLLLHHHLRPQDLSPLRFVQIAKQGQRQSRNLHDKLLESLVLQQERDIRLGFRQEDVPDGIAGCTSIGDTQCGDEVVYVLCWVAEFVDVLDHESTEGRDVVFVRDGPDLYEKSRSIAVAQVRGKVEVEVVEEIDQSLEGVWVVVGQVNLRGSCFLICPGQYVAYWSVSGDQSSLTLNLPSRRARKTSDCVQRMALWTFNLLSPQVRVMSENEPDARRLCAMSVESLE